MPKVKTEIRHRSLWPMIGHDVEKGMTSLHTVREHQGRRSRGAGEAVLQRKYFYPHLRTCYRNFKH